MLPALSALPFLLVIALLAAMLVAAVRTSGDKVLAALHGPGAGGRSPAPPWPLSRRVRTGSLARRSSRPLRAAA